MTVLIIIIITLLGGLGAIAAVTTFIIILVKQSNGKARTTRTAPRPPPIPESSSTMTAQKSPAESGIRRVWFDSSKYGLLTPEREQAMLEASQKAATDWLNKNPSVDVISINTTMGKMNAAVTVWYKKQD